MSNQVYSAGLNSRYLPSVQEYDMLALTPNVAAVPGVSPAYGTAIKSANGTGNGLYMNRLNGVDVSIVSGVVNYSNAQNVATKPYWNINAASAVKNGATLLYSLVDNVIGINAVVPMFLKNNGTSAPVTLALAARVYNSDGSVYATYGYNGLMAFEFVPTVSGTGGNNALSTGASITPIPFSYSGVVRVPAGKSLSIIILCSSTAWDATGPNVQYQDYLAPETDIPGFTSVVQMPCIVEFVKL